MEHAVQRWQDVSLSQFEDFLWSYPSALEVHPPPAVTTANFREWRDPALGAWPGNVVAKEHRRGRCVVRQVRMR
jgi:hypothetical protein